MSGSCVLESLVSGSWDLRSRVSGPDFRLSLFREHFQTTASTIAETCFEFQISEESAIRSLNKADVRFERKRELV